jgi:hypothetical protein
VEVKRMQGKSKERALGTDYLYAVKFVERFLKRPDSQMATVKIGVEVLCVSQVRSMIR